VQNIVFPLHTAFGAFSSAFSNINVIIYFANKSTIITVYITRVYVDMWARFPSLATQSAILLARPSVNVLGFSDKIAPFAFCRTSIHKLMGRILTFVSALASIIALTLVGMRRRYSCITALITAIVADIGINMIPHLAVRAA
jgi:hypothetical protein